MKTLFDYYKRTLGISLKPRVQKKGLSTQEEVLQKFEEPFYFYASEVDREINKDMIFKILKASGCSWDVFIKKEQIQYVLEEGRPLFSFGGEGVPEGGVENFPSFSKISTDQSLKSKLWGLLKGYAS